MTLSPFQVAFPSGAKVSTGNEIAASDVKDHPSKITYPTEEGAYYALVIAG
jgi:hypothetical protein